MDDKQVLQHPSG